MKPSLGRVLGIFPGLGYFDGIGRSGLAAWKGVCATPAVDPTLITYGAAPPPDGVPGRILYSGSHAGTIMNALRAGGSAHTILVWHVHLLVLLPFLRSRGRVVVYLHGIEAWCRLNAALRLQLGRVDLVLTNSDYTWSRFLEANPEFSSLPHSTVALGLDAAVRAPVPHPEGPPSALMIGRISRSEAYKGHDAVVAAWPEVRRRIRDAELHIIGPGDLYEEMRSLAIRHHVADACHLHGPVSQERKEELLVNSRCMAMPSKGEGFGLAYVESMRLGRPCLVSRSDAGREVVNPPEAGLAADPDNASELATALCTLLSGGSDWDIQSVQARQRYESRFTEAAFASRLNAALGLA